MRTLEAHEIIQSGDLFELKSRREGEPAYLSRGFSGSYLQVAEIGGENRNKLYVAPSDLPPPDSYQKWPFQAPVEGKVETYVNGILDTLRTNLSNLRFAIEHNFTLSGISPVPEEPLPVYENLPEGNLFGRALYRLHGGGVRLFFTEVDVTQLGVINESYIRRGSEGAPPSFDGAVSDMTVTSEDIECIEAAVTKAGFVCNAGAHVSANIFPKGQRDSLALSHLTGYLPGVAITYSSLAEAHAAVQQAIKRC